MEIVVCVKQVPDTEALIKVGADGKSLDPTGIRWVVNPYDEFGIEEALRIKEKVGGTVTLVSVGPQRAVEALRTGMAMGADNSILVDDLAAEGSDSQGIAHILASVIRGIPHDIIICGLRAVDDEYAQVPYTLADALGLPLLPTATKVDISGNKVIITRPIEGAVLTLEAPVPLVITTQRGLNEPRMASLPGIIKAKKKSIDIKKLADLGIDPGRVGAVSSKIEVLNMSLPPRREAGRIIEGANFQEKIAKLMQLMKDEAKVL